MTRTVSDTRSRTIAWTDPSRTRFQLRGLDGYERLAATKRGDASPPPAVELLGLSLDELERGRTVFSVVADELHENPMGTMHGGVSSRRWSTPPWDARCHRRFLPTRDSRRSS
jgi:hypothetical protein